MAGDFTDSSRDERQWELLFRGGGTHAGAGQKFLGSHLLAAAQGRNAGLTVTRNAFPAGSGTLLYLTGGESGAVKWYSAKKYSVQRGDPLASSYGFLEVNSAVPSQNPWGTDTSKTHEQTYTLISVDGDELRVQTYMLRYDGKSNRMMKEPYLYDSLVLHRGAALRCRAAAPASKGLIRTPCGRRSSLPAILSRTASKNRQISRLGCS